MYYSSNYHYTLQNCYTNKIFFESDDLKKVISFFHKIAKRKVKNAIVVFDNLTGEILKCK